MDAVRTGARSKTVSLYLPEELLIQVTRLQAREMGKSGMKFSRNSFFAAAIKREVDRVLRNDKMEVDR